jgi:Galactosyltransferase
MKDLAVSGWHPEDHNPMVLPSITDRPNPREDTLSPINRMSNPVGRILLGIFTTNSKNDESRRQLIRKTYLTNFQTLQKVGLSSDAKTMVCSLADFMESGSKNDDCSIIYTFVMGAMDSSNTTAPTDLTEREDQEHISYVVDRPSSSLDTSEHRDILYLNVRENMNEGKTMTWFRYASSILPVEELGIDLIAKIDQDTVIFPRLLLQDLNQQIPVRPARRLYGGHRLEGKSSGTRYMQGGAYFLSTDIAKQITSSACPRSNIIQRYTAKWGHTRAEDREIGLFVDQCCWSNQMGGNSTTSSVGLVFTNHLHHNRANKKEVGFRVRWKEGLASDIATLRHDIVTKKYEATHGCPSSKALAQAEEAWFDEFEKMGIAKRRYMKMVSASCPSLADAYE